MLLTTTFYLLVFFSYNVGKTIINGRGGQKKKLNKTN